MVVKIHAVEGEQISGIVCANSHIFVIKCAKDNPSAVELVSKIDLSNLNFLIASVNQQKSKGDAEHKLTILSSDVSADKRLLVVATTTKHIILFELTSFLNCGDGIGIHEEAKWRTIHKTPTSVHFSACGEALLVSTRSGSLTQYRIIDANFSADNAVELLSHFSMLLDHCLSPGKPKFLLSADRDEKIRVSRYPNTQIIECFCLGHDSFVSSVCCLDDEIAVSGGGDGVLRLWQFKVGKCLCVSPKLNNSPIRKIFPFTKNNKIFVLFDNSSEISLFNFDSRGPSVEFSRTFVGDGHLFDFAIDGKSNRIFAVGRKGLFHCEIDANSAESIGMEMIDLGGEKVPLLMTELANATEVFPLEQLYKTVTFGNLENYQQKKEERKRRKRTGTELADDKKGEKKTGEDGD